VGVHALVVDNVEAVKTLTNLSLKGNSIKSEGAKILAYALGRNAMPSLKRLDLGRCGVDDDGFVALVSALEHNTSLQILNFLHGYFREGRHIGKRGLMALAETLPSIKGLQQINFRSEESFQSVLHLLLEGFRKNTSLVEVAISGYAPGERSQEIKVLGLRNRITTLLKASDAPGTSPPLGIWSRALAKVATEPDVLFHVASRLGPLVARRRGTGAGPDQDYEGDNILAAAKAAEEEAQHMNRRTTLSDHMGLGTGLGMGTGLDGLFGRNNSPATAESSHGLPNVSISNNSSMNTSSRPPAPTNQKRKARPLNPIKSYQEHLVAIMEWDPMTAKTPDDECAYGERKLSSSEQLNEEKAPSFKGRSAVKSSDLFRVSDVLHHDDGEDSNDSSTTSSSHTNLHPNAHTEPYATASNIVSVQTVPAPPPPHDRIKDFKSAVSIRDKAPDDGLVDSNEDVDIEAEY
jgi:hypothetical protein